MVIAKSEKMSKYVVYRLTQNKVLAAFRRTVSGFRRPKANTNAVAPVQVETIEDRERVASAARIYDGTGVTICSEDEQKL
jgi:hypothetical protein